ncbi:hypothetical protein [Nakamurella leprariae]|uniref:Uncharacterized protein n=1 Tax=Nakamurella leprariae TaxID=2803911 RepID=A0A939BYB1_9ACTN|nr:hypothetical protein [Nakamurella leprariae]MBM9466421.1 hypothetical protein [Nakamurella leprariae]
MKLTVAELRSRASAVLDQLQDMTDVRLVSMSCEAEQPIDFGPFEVSTALSVRSPAEDSAREVYVFSKYVVQARSVQDDDSIEEARPVAWRVELEMVGTWGRRGGNSALLDSADLTCFAVLVGAMALHPYARETVQSTVGRLGFPPFTMDILHSIDGGSGEVEIDVD